MEEKKHRADAGGCCTGIRRRPDRRGGQALAKACPTNHHERSDVLENRRGSFARQPAPRMGIIGSYRHESTGDSVRDRSAPVIFCPRRVPRGRFPFMGPTLFVSSHFSPDQDWQNLDLARLSPPASFITSGPLASCWSPRRCRGRCWREFRPGSCRLRCLRRLQG
jgi:hypothetical protein